MSFSRYLHPEEEHNGSAGVVGVLPRDERGHDEAKKSREDRHHRQGRYGAEENLEKKQNLGQSSNCLPTVSLLLLMARIAAMKKVLSPISETRITDKDSTNPCRKPSRQKVFESTYI